MARTEISAVESRWVLDSRGNPTVQVGITLEGGAQGSAIVPSGASTGAHEALELRDAGAAFHGKGVDLAVANAMGPLREAVQGLDALDQRGVDAAMRTADGTPNLATLGANAVLGISLATAHAAARAQARPLWHWVAELMGEAGPRLPVPMMNVLNGGAHADNGLDVQEIMIAPAGFPTWNAALRAGAEIYQSLKTLLHDQGLSIAIGDEGGFAPHVKTNGEAVDLVAAAIEKAGYTPGEQVLLSLDVAATEFVSDGGYAFEGRPHSGEELGTIYASWCARHPIYSIEDGLGEDDWAAWSTMTRSLGDNLQLVGDDLFVTDTRRLERGIGEGVANAVLIKPNQIGTLSDTMDCVQMAYDAGYAAVMSHRSGETEDTTIADLAVAMGTGQIKTGAPCRGERTAKYNRLLEIEDELLARHGEAAFGFREARLGRKVGGAA